MFDLNRNTFAMAAAQKAAAPGKRPATSYWRGAWKALVISLIAVFALQTPAGFAATSLLTPDSRRDLELQPGVVLIYVQFKATLGPWSVTPGFWGSGFLYRPDGYLITNGHVAQLANEKDPKAIQRRIQIAAPLVTKAVLDAEAKRASRDLTADEKQQILGQLQKLYESGAIEIEEMSLNVLLSNGKRYVGEIKAYSDPVDENGKDVAIIKIDGKNLPTVALGNSDNVNVGDPLTVIGYPGEALNASLNGFFSAGSVLVPTVTTGRISAVNKSDYKGTPVLQSEATINHGNSGGPAFDADGEVIGVATYTLNKSDGVVSGLNFFVPINTVMEFVRQAGAPPERGAFDEIWQRALDAYAGKHWYKAHALMGSVLEMMPNQPDALKLQLQATENLREEGFFGYWLDRIGVAGLSAVGVALAVLIVLIVLSGLRKPKAKAKVTTGTIAIPHPVASGQKLPNAAVTPAATLVAQAAPTPALAEQESFGSLYVNNGPLRGNRFPIPKKGLLIGRDPSLCSIVLSDETVSKEHAWVVPLDNGVAVIDRSSVNGTYINSADSQRISKIILKSNDRIFIGRKNPTEITYFSA